MSEFTMDRLVTDIAVVLSAMTKSEKVLLDRVRRLRLAQHPEWHLNSEPPPSRATALPSGTYSSNAAVAPDVPSSWQPQPERTTAAYERAPAAAAAGHRDYNYFAELDEKLTGLRQRYLE